MSSEDCAQTPGPGLGSNGAVLVFSQAGDLRHLQEDTPARELDCQKTLIKAYEQTRGGWRGL